MMLPVVRLTQNVDRNGYIHLQLPNLSGMKVEVIVVPITADLPASALENATLQTQSGFALNVLADSAEDVWNEL